VGRLAERLLHGGARIGPRDAPVLSDGGGHAVRCENAVPRLRQMDSSKEGAVLPESSVATVHLGTGYRDSDAGSLLPIPHPCCDLTVVCGVAVPPRSDIERFGKFVKLTAFKPFTSAMDALANCNSVSEGAFTVAESQARY
jgi:hypothetical protein